MAAKGALARYHRRRDFSKTAEPEGRLAEPSSNGSPSYVVQIHDARSMHFDFRLEADGVLKSFAVPKGPSRDPHDKRFATPTEDHPLEYRDFEGVIPPGEYGGGAVIVWDEGTYRNVSSDRAGHEIPLAEALERGHASFWLDGRKLHGGYSLTRIRTGEGGGREAWLLVKHADERAASTGTPDPRRARSARTGRTLGQVAAAVRAAGDRR
ncbi:DNA polymerase ligase N-terminal domain-containing protein [Streptomyces sp. LARHCF249]